MPARARGAENEQKKIENFNTFKTSEENTQCEILQKYRKVEAHELKDFEDGFDDILDEWSPVLNAIFKLVEVLKVPGRKAKSYDQTIFRTMVFKRLQADFIEIDGKSYEVTNSCNQDHFDCKEKFLNIIRHIDQGYDDDYLQPDTFPSWKKELVSKLKDFEKKYVKHAKSTNPVLAKIHLEAMTPVVDLMDASVNLQNFRTLSKTRSFPEFRKKALYEKFIEHLTRVCDIIKAFPTKEGKTLDQEYDIRHILEILDTEGWEDIPPFRFYFMPLQQAYDDLVKELREMWKKGPLHVSYYVERNLGMHKKIIAMVRQYNIVKQLAGDQLKQDQFQFMYSVHDKIYNSALKDVYLNLKQNAAANTVVVPELTVFKAMLLIRDIDDRKAADIAKKAKKKAEREALGLSEEEEEELKLDIPQPVQVKGKKKKVEVDPEVIEEARVKALYKRELATYGRTWIWENYFKDDEERKSYWLAGAAALRRINVQVLEDIEDYLLLKGFMSGNNMMSQREIQQIIETFLHEKREREKMELLIAADKDEQIVDPLETGQVEDQKRNFIVNYRPHQDVKVWNFIEDNEESKIPHVLRANADPNKAYIDGRVGLLLIIIEGMAQHLSLHTQQAWDHLSKHTMLIFKDHEEKMNRRMTDFEKAQEEAAQK